MTGTKLLMLGASSTSNFGPSLRTKSAIFRS